MIGPGDSRRIAMAAMTRMGEANARAVAETTMSMARRSTAGIVAVVGEHRPKSGLRWAAVKVREIIRLIEADGWRQVRQSGSHRHFRHPRKAGTATVAGHPRDDLHPKTKASIMRQTGLWK